MKKSVILTNVEKKLVQQAIQRHRRIFLCSDKKELSQCFTTADNKRLFWFNTLDKSTHVVMEDLEPAF